MNLKIEVNEATLGKNYKVEGIGKDTDKTSVVELGFSFESDKDILQQLCLIKGVESMLWHDKKPIPGLKHSTLLTKWKFNQVFFAGLQMDNCLVFGVVLKPLDGERLVVSLKVKFRNPSGKQLAGLAKASGKCGELQVISAPDLFDVSDD